MDIWYGQFFCFAIVVKKLDLLKNMKLGILMRTEAGIMGEINDFKKGR